MSSHAQIRPLKTRKIGAEISQKKRQWGDKESGGWYYVENFKYSFHEDLNCAASLA